MSNSRQSGAVVPFGISFRSYGQGLKSWATRRDRYGPSGYTKNGRRRVIQKRRARLKRHGNQHRGKRRCKRGHYFTHTNTYVTSTGSRQCRACVLLVRNWKRALRHELERVKRLKRAIYDAHPDKPGGSSYKFREAKKAHLRAERRYAKALGRFDAERLEEFPVVWSYIPPDR